ncbi:uncharacterized protein PGTG_11509 [Puccinia graminis f. sp. tritici CRL 75-36-700-3]|uniref:Fork-head domain-containing protein n=1 Tax=Puccinia graminis f. sp. tritici (strain CRL 75-36-700-3 / race SCCL) TaxID=418459 RepID=E3KLZ1_PUCGT|nr:uncharacterized protein PGTG_11509 [Puccinia graminis f. sp. tritici CRL 75-36-700-3]EFP85340.2 hypothetical protein PGTG_11509 [Puccinia graminis f. sp. tritici CRL 75-36-700-3]
MMAEPIPVPLDIEALSAEIFDSINEQLQIGLGIEIGIGTTTDQHEENNTTPTVEGEDEEDQMIIDTNSLDYHLQQAVAEESLNNTLINQHQQQSSSSSNPSLDELFNQSDVSELIQSLLRATLPQPELSLEQEPSLELEPSTEPLPEPQSLVNSSDLNSQPTTAIIDPTLESTSPPITLSAPHSPQPSLRSDASTSQLPSLIPIPQLHQQQQPQQQQQQQQPNTPKPTSSTTTLTPANIKISSLDQLANPPLGQQPNYPWWTIIRAAIMGSRYGILNREEIFDALQRRWEYFRSTSDQATRVWKSAVGHNLSVKECFVRVHVQGKKNVSYYIVDTAVDPAKGRLSKAKNSTTSATDRMSIPTISRKLVLPSDFDLSIQARWSPAIAAIRNAKHGYPTTNQMRVRQTSSSSHSQTEHHSGTDSSTDSETESEDTTTETEPITTPNGRSNPRRLGSSLSAIIETSSTRRAPPVPRLAFSRSLSNALVAAPPPSRRRNLSARNSSSTATLTRPPSSSRPSFPARPLIPPSTPQPISTSHSDSHPHSPPDFSSLQDHVNAALADVAACLPEIEFHNNSQTDTHDQEEAPPHGGGGGDIGQNTMIDIHSSIFDPLPEIDLDAILREAQAEIQVENQTQVSSENQPDQDLVGPEEAQENEEEKEKDQAQENVEKEKEKEDEDSLVPTAADFDRLLASMISEHGANSPANQTIVMEENRGVSVGSKRTTEEAGLSDLLQDLIDEAQQQQGHQESPPEAGEASDAQGFCGGGGGEEDESREEAMMEASRMLEMEIEEALKRAEEQEMRRAEEIERQRELSMNVSQQQQMTTTRADDIPVHPAAADIPVHPLPPSEPAAAPSAAVAAPSRARPTPRARSDRRTTHNRPSSVRSVRPPVIRPTLLRCLPNPPSTTSSSSTANSTAASSSSSSSLIDRRTRASGLRTVGRKLNLPLPSSHTLPPLDSSSSSSNHPISTSTLSQQKQNSSASASPGGAGGDELSALTPGFLDSIPVVCLQKPKATFPELAKEAILAHPDGKLTAAEIFKVLEKKYPYFVDAAESWKATLRNVLTSHSCFVKIPRPPDAPGRGDWWATVDLPLWKRRRTTAKAKQDEDFVGRHAREHSRRQCSSSTPTPTPTSTRPTTARTTGSTVGPGSTRIGAMVGTPSNPTGQRTPSTLPSLSSDAQHNIAQDHLGQLENRTQNDLLVHSDPIFHHLNLARGQLPSESPSGSGSIPIEPLLLLLGGS